MKTEDKYITELWPNRIFKIINFSITLDGVCNKVELKDLENGQILEASESEFLKHFKKKEIK